MRLLRDLARRKGSGAVVVSRDERLLEIADQVLCLEDGRLVASPAPGGEIPPGEAPPLLLLIRLHP
jgi:ABC-type lipoprotein export system ATPase subunit